MVLFETPVDIISNLGIDIQWDRACKKTFKCVVLFRIIQLKGSNSVNHMHIQGTLPILPVGLVSKHAQNKHEREFIKRRKKEEEHNYRLVCIQKVTFRSHGSSTDPEGHARLA